MLQQEDLEGLFERIDKIIEYKNISKRQFCAKIGVSYGFLSKPVDIGVSKMMSICRNYPDISLEWLLLNEGNMLKGKDNQPQSENDDSIIGKLITMIEGKDEQMNSLLKQLDTASGISSEKDKVIIALTNKLTSR